MKIPKKIIEILMGEKYHQLATCDKSSIPNVCTFGAKYMLGDEKIVIIDNYFKKTLSNILINPNVAILVRKDKESYKIVGKAVYQTKGKIYEEVKQWTVSEGKNYSIKGVVVVEPKEFYISTPGPRAGEQMN